MIGWTALLAGVLAVAELLDKIRFPAPQMIVAIIVGAILALAGRLPAPLPRQVSVGVQAMLGVLMGSYLEVSLLGSIGLALLPVLAITAATLVVSLLVALVFARCTRVALPTATLGLLAGGSAAVVSCADDMDADPRQVAFMQYLRVLLVAVSAPAVAALLDPGEHTEHVSVVASRVTNAALPHWALVGRGDQVAGLCIAIVLCLLGIRIGRLLKLPSPTLIGPMLITAALTALGLSHGYAPTNMFKELLFVLIGFDVGTRFTRAVVMEMARMIPGMTIAIGVLSIAVAALAYVLSLFVDLELSDLYLATTPGGINAVLAAAEGMGANMPLITSVQSIRLLFMVAMLPLMGKLFRHWTARQATTRIATQIAAAQPTPAPDTPIVEAEELPPLPPAEPEPATVRTT
ncbi:AbrB family transcriptional regulator [Nocardia sp. CDC159]|uniref:AbrB family transcriptional regulator n=1 Tax=Nocardia pulmonis TaxID=2951408 RepID=A0A9X2EH67_9NOCA|nr:MULTISPECIES: AbrB family transcriptional regulator [Nocardia]MCM6778623.1 AbrB family transcriptional regulator [Nocardia pulmonis]MCM6791512.1 AbrB family transcriptional regulator [Nocardia sp. CDC159]